MSSIIKTEQAVYDFLKNIFSGSGYNVYRGSVPKPKHKDREETTGQETLRTYPCVVVRINSTSQVRESWDSYSCELLFDIIVGTKNEDYLENIEKAEWIKGKLLDELYDETGFVINQSRDFKVEYYNDEYDPFIFSKISFVMMGSPVVPNKNIVERFY